MKIESVIWGVLLLFIGGVLLLQNLDIIHFYWRNVWSFWPVLLIIFGINILFNRNHSRIGSIISLCILVVTLVFLFFRGQERPQHSWWAGKIGKNLHIEIDDSETDYQNKNYTVPFEHNDEQKKCVLNLYAGGTSFKLKGSTDSLITAFVKKKSGNFSMERVTEDSTNTVTFRMKDERRSRGWNIADGGNKVDLYLNEWPTWDIHLKMGAGEVDFDLSPYKVRYLQIDGGAADLNMKLGQQLALTEVKVKTGVASVKIEVPESSGCQIKTRTGLSSKDFKGFTKISEGLYESPNYAHSQHKILINFDGGLSSFEVKRY